VSQPQPAPERKPALLVVDDDPLITDTLAFALGGDYEVLACESRRHAIELLRQLPGSRWWTSGCRLRRTRPTRASS
jgi:hypothetical protein